MTKNWKNDLTKNLIKDKQEITKHPINLNDLDDIVVEGIDYKDYPDFCDAYIAFAILYGKECTDTELDEINKDSDFVYQCVLNHIN